MIIIVTNDNDRSTIYECLSTDYLFSRIFQIQSTARQHFHLFPALFIYICYCEWMTSLKEEQEPVRILCTHQDSVRVTSSETLMNIREKILLNIVIR